MSPRPAGARETIEAWRTQLADAPEPWRFHVIDALERRAAHHSGQARQRLDRRLSQLMDSYAKDLAATKKSAVEPANATISSMPVRGPLGALVDQITGQAQQENERADRGDASQSAREPADLPVLDAFRETWSRLRTQSQLQQVRQQPPTDAGPLNSATLVHRSMALMRSLSPEYLTHFLSYIDDLSWMEQLAGGMSSTPNTARPGSAKKRTRSKSKTAPRD